MNRRVWLVKVPEFFANRLDDFTDECEQRGIDSEFYVGRVRSAGGGKLSLLLDAEGPMGSLPLEYALVSSKPSQQMHMLAHEEGDFIGIQGKVEQECRLQPNLQCPRYQEILRQRNTMANQPKRTIQAIDINARGESTVPHLRDRDLLQTSTRNNPRRIDEKRERIPRADLINILFGIFERQKTVSFAELERQTQQPAAFLKEVLGDIAIYNKRGPHKHLYELMPAYQRSKK